MHQRSRAIAFFPIPSLHLPHNYREYYLSRELAERGWSVSWLRPRSGENRGVSIEWPVIEFHDMDFRGRKYHLPVYLGTKLRRAGTHLVWLSGWNIRSRPHLYWMVRILKTLGLRIVYDPIDPICEFAAAQDDASVDRACACDLAQVYSMCDLTFCVTPEIRDLLVSNGAPADRLRIARWGTDGRLFDPATARCDLKDRLGLDPSAFLVGWLGGMELYKGLREVIMPLVETLSRDHPDIHFVIAGRGTLEPEIRRWAEERPHLAVTILPAIPYEEAPGFTGSLDAYLVPTNPRSSYAEAICPIKCFDALAMGTPLVVTRTEGTAFLDEYPTVSFARFDHDSFLAALLELYRVRRPDRPQQSVTRFTHQQVSKEIADALETIVP